MNDLKSLQRKLQDTLVLLVKQKDSTMWEAPHAEVIGERETLQQVCSALVNMNMLQTFICFVEA